MRGRIWNIVGVATAIYTLVVVTMVWTNPELLDPMRTFAYAYLIILISILVVAEVTFSFLSFDLVAKSKVLAELSRDPDVQMRLSMRPDRKFYMVVWNVGSGGAYHIVFRTKRDMRIRGRIHFGNLLWMRKGIEYLAPGQWHYYHIGRIPEARTARDPVIDIIVTYYNQFGEKLADRFVIDLAVYRHMMIWPPPKGSLGNDDNRPPKDLNAVPGFRIRQVAGIIPTEDGGSKDSELWGNEPRRTVTFFRKSPMRDAGETDDDRWK